MACLLGVVYPAAAATYAWDAGGAGNASDLSNWDWDGGGQPGNLPGTNDHIVLDNSSSENMVWDGGADTGDGTLTLTVASWTQTEDYAGTATIAALYGASGFTNFTVSGDASIKGGTWYHSQNSAAETYRLRVTVGGDLFISNAVFNAYRRGYTSRTAAAPGYLANHGGAYGGSAQKGSASGTFNLQTYGSITAPVNLGSPGYGASGTGDGGGAISADLLGCSTAGRLGDSYGGAHGGAATARVASGGASSVNTKTYGSILAPTDLGSKGGYTGGGGHHSERTGHHHRNGARQNLGQRLRRKRRRKRRKRVPAHGKPSGQRYDSSQRRYQ
ncbi:hypothetical protein ACFLQU_05015 [Verrucomicrobiota bacterium]